MARRTQEVIECDVCGKEAERYIVIFPHEGQLILDRCSRHNGKIRALKEEGGQWFSKSQRRNTFEVSDPEELLRKYGLKQ
jgi:hypothetical protein